MAKKRAISNSPFHSSLVVFKYYTISMGKIGVFFFKKNKIQNKSKTAQWDSFNFFKPSSNLFKAWCNQVKLLHHYFQTSLGWAGLGWHGKIFIFFSKSSCYKGILRTAILAVKNSHFDIFCRQIKNKKTMLKRNIT